MGIRSFIHRLTAPPIREYVPAGNYKLAIIVNTALKMKKGKVHAEVYLHLILSMVLLNSFSEEKCFRSSCFL